MPASMTHSSPRAAHLRVGLGFVLAVLGGCEFKLGELEPGGTTGSGDTSTSTSATTGVQEDTEATPYGSTTAELPQPPGCCAPHAEPGCVDEEIAACVCEFDRFCCTNEWDGRCVDRIAELGCGVCNGNEGSCCDKSRSPGCGDADVQSCVCKLDPFCCTDRWDEACVERVGALGCGVCEGDDDTEGGTKPSATCCEPGGVGCVDLDIEACVCSQDEYCCSTGWDDVCVSKVEALGCGDCGSGPYDVDDCCSAADGICSDPLIAGCVCSQLPECCEGPWTDSCVAAIDLLGCGTCPPLPEAESSSGFESESSSTSG